MTVLCRPEPWKAGTVSQVVTAQLGLVGTAAALALVTSGFDGPTGWGCPTGWGEAGLCSRGPPAPCWGAGAIPSPTYLHAGEHLLWRQALFRETSVAANKSDRSPRWCACRFLVGKDDEGLSHGNTPLPGMTRCQARRGEGLHWVPVTVLSLGDF